ncbi:hypothetical protein N8Z59_04150 [Planktomarina temperata]|nr:hypothetical protein [Planktomarina temperata]
MKRTLTALTVAASVIAGGASAFELNTTTTERLEMTGKRMVSDLTVGVKALIERYTWLTCNLDGKMHLKSFTEIVTDPSKYESYYEIQLEADGEFTMTISPGKSSISGKGGYKDLPGFPNSKCSDVLDTNPEVTFIPVKSINGFTDTRSLLIDLINQGYE